MHLAYPHYLWILLLLPALAWRLRTRHQLALRFSSFHLFEPHLPDSARVADIVGIGVRLAICALLIIGLARPLWPDEATRIPVRTHAVEMVLDVSGSMAERDFQFGDQSLSRLEAAKRAFHRFVIGGEDLPGRPDDMIGLVTFAARSDVAWPPTLSRTGLLRMLNEAQPHGLPPESSTNIGDALAEACQLLQSSAPKQKVIVLLSDGEHNVPATVVAGALKPRQAARLAQAFGIRVYTIFVGPETADGPAQEAQDALNDVADMTGGRCFLAHDTDTLLTSCCDIDRLERTRVESFQYHRYHEAYPWLGLAALALWAAIGLLESTRWMRVP